MILPIHLDYLIPTLGYKLYKAKARITLGKTLSRILIPILDKGISRRKVILKYLHYIRYYG
jgi:hypothetical protein